jgi:hypothetical protein
MKQNQQQSYSVARVAITLTLASFGCGPALTSASFLSPVPEPKPADHPVRFYAEARPQCPYEATVSL